MNIPQREVHIARLLRLRPRLNVSPRVLQNLAVPFIGLVWTLRGLDMRMTCLTREGTIELVYVRGDNIHLR